MKIMKDIDYYSKKNFNKKLPVELRVVNYKKQNNGRNTMINFRLGPSSFIYPIYFLPPFNICWIIWKVFLGSHEIKLFI
jgi:hypothetical protein